MEKVDPTTSLEVNFFGIVRLVDGCIIVHELPDGCIQSCEFNDCDEFATYSLMLVEPNTDTASLEITYHCGHHFREALRMQELCIPLRVRH